MIVGQLQQQLLPSSNISKLFCYELQILWLERKCGGGGLEGIIAVCGEVSFWTHIVSKQEICPVSSSFTKFYLCTPSREILCCMYFCNDKKWDWLGHFRGNSLPNGPLAFYYHSCQLYYGWVSITSKENCICCCTGMEWIYINACSKWKESISQTAPSSH